MEDIGDRIADRVQALSDIELAVLLCLISEQHCIIATEKAAIDDLDQEIRLVRHVQTSKILRADRHRSLRTSSVLRGQYWSVMRTRRWMILEMASL